MRVLSLVLVALVACSPKSSDDGADTDTEVVDTEVVDTEVVDTEVVDTEITCDDPDASGDPCSKCLTCANAGPCGDLDAACASNAECEAIRTCAAACGTPECANACVLDHPDGKNDMVAWYTCVLDTCAVTCPQ